MDEYTGFPRWERLHKRREYLEVYNRGEKAYAPHLVIYVLPNGLAHHRLGITVSRKVGKAAIRNRVKRRLREIFRSNRPQSEVCFDIVVNVRKSAADAAFDDLLQEFRAALERWRDTGSGP